MCVWEGPAPGIPGSLVRGEPWSSGFAPRPDQLPSLPFSPAPVWFYFGVVGSFIFILIQLALLIDFAHSWNQHWLGNAEERDSRAWYAGQCRLPASGGPELPEESGGL